MALWIHGFVAMWISANISRVQKFYVITHLFQKFKSLESQISKDNMFQNVSIYFLIFLKPFGVIKKNNRIRKIIDTECPPKDK